MNPTTKKIAGGLMILAALAAALAALMLEVQAAREEASREPGIETRTLRWLDLNEEEWAQYRARRELVGRPLADLTPYEVLGMYADDPDQQRRYAVANARFMLDFYRRTMAFEQVYREELSKLSGTALQN